MIPAKSLPIMDFINSVLPAPLQPVAKPFIDLVSPVYKVLADLGYDWSGDPGTEKWLSILPFNPIQNWPGVGLNLVAATIQGIGAFIGDLGGLTTILPATVAPTSPPPVSMLAAARTTLTSSPTEPTETTETTTNVPASKQSTSKLTLVKDTETTVQQTAVANDSKSADETPVTKPEDTPVTKPEEATKPETTVDKTKSDDKKDATDTKDATDKKTDTDKKDANDKKTDTDKKDANDKKADTDKKDADTAKAAA
jgi:hypothetical protein